MKKYFLIIVFLVFSLFFSHVNSVEAETETYQCGQTYQYVHDETDCDCANDDVMGYGWHCCGWYTGESCLAEDPDQNPPAEDGDGDGAAQPQVPDLSTQDLKDLNPLVQFGQDDEIDDPDQQLINDDGSLNPSGVINRALNLLFPLAGIALFVMLVWGGFEMLTGAAKKQALDSGKQRITAALIGFVLLFVSYWLVQIIETITGVVILG